MFIRFALFIVFCAFVLFMGGVAVLAAWDIPVVQIPVEKLLDNSKL